MRIVATFMDKGTKQTINVGCEKNPRKTIEGHIPMLTREATVKLECETSDLRYLGFKTIEGRSVLGALPKDYRNMRGMR